MAQPLPQLLRDVRGIGLDQAHRGLGGEPRSRIVRVPVDLVHELHHRRDRRVQREAPPDVVRDLGDRAMRLPGERRVGHGLDDRLIRLLQHDAPKPIEEADDALEPGVLPLGVLLDRADEEQVHADRVGSVSLDVLVRRDRVALRLRHLRAVAVEHSLREQAREGLPKPDHPEVVQHLHEEARVEQVQDRVLDTADVLIDREPVVDELAVERRVIVVRRRRSAGSTRTSRRTCPWCRSRAGPSRPHFGQVVRTQSSAAASGERPFGRYSVTSGSRTGSSSSGTGTIPHSSQ